MKKMTENIMGRFAKYTRYSCCVMVLLLTSCFRDGLEECPPSQYNSYIKFVYDYNMSFVDLFHKQVSSLDIYLFDENDTFLHRIIEKTPDGSPFSKGYTLGLPDAFSNAKKLVVFAGTDDEQQSLAVMIPGKSKLNDLSLSLNDRADNRVDCRLRPLWHGNICDAATGTINLSGDTTTVSLTKNTNVIRIMLQSLVDSLDVDVNDFSFELQTINGACDAYNAVCDDKKWCYCPYIMENVGEGGAVAELNTLRLLSDRENRLLIKHISSDETILDINLNKYLHGLKLSNYSDMSFDEYLDREDEYEIAVFLTAMENPTPSIPSIDPVHWVAVYATINKWILREQSGGI